MKKGFCFRVTISVAFLLLFLGVGSSAYAEKKFIKGEARFYSQDEDPLNFVKSQLLEKSFRNVITKEMNRLGFNSESFWRTFDEKFEEHFKPMQESLEEKFQDPETEKMEAEDREKYQKALRVRRLKELKKFGKLSHVIKSYVIKRMKRSVKYPNSRYMRLMAVVDHNRLRSLYSRYINIGGKKEFNTLFLDVDFELQGLTWKDLGVQVKTDFTEVIKTHWLNWFNSKLGDSVKKFSIIERNSKDKVEAYLHSYKSENERDEIFQDGLLAKVKFKIKKNSEDGVQKMRGFSFKGQYLLLDLDTQEPLDYFDFPKTTHSYSTVDDHSLSSQVASYLYRVPIPRFEKSKNKLNRIMKKKGSYQLEVENVLSIQEVMELMGLLKEKGIVQRLQPKVKLFDQGRALIELDYYSDYEALKKVILKLQSRNLLNGRSIYVKKNDHGYYVLLGGEAIQSKKQEAQKIERL
tara:strand:+ start:1532 stop:2920 length:1389 start_codon:yes stop_codon:yes gene_type:complete